MKEKTKSIIGWIGVLLILIDYAGINFDLINVNSPVYHSLNLIGSAALLYIAFNKKVYQSIFLNILWALVAIYGLVKLI